MGQNTTDIVLEDVSCPLGCDRDDEPVLIAPEWLGRIPLHFTVVRCRRCGLQRTNPRPVPAAMGVFYPDDYSPHADVGDRAANRERRSFVKRLFIRVFDLQDRLLPRRPPGRLLEVGCASGGFLFESAADGWDVQGIEFSQRAAAKARALGFDVQVSAIEDAVPPAAPVDLIVAWMVIEHLHYPVPALRRMREWLAPGGVLAISIPDVASGTRRLFGAASFDLQLPTHLFHYTAATITSVLVAAGWRVERIRWQRNAMTLLKSLATVLEQRSAHRSLSLVRWLMLSKHAVTPRLLLNWLAGVTRQSGRIEVWASPDGLSVREHARSEVGWHSPGTRAASTQP